MKRVIVIGCPGSGKTTFAEKLSKITGLPLYYLDAIWHKPDKTHISREEFDQRIQEIFATDKWIIDGNYNSKEQILSLEIERMPKEYGVRVGDVLRNPYLSVCSTSTHDMSPLRLWWRDEAERQYYFEKVLGEEGEAPAEATVELCEKIVARHLASPSMLTILPLQDWLSLSEELRSSDIERERINIPAVAHHYWRYRMHITLEKLLSASDYNEKIKLLIASAKKIG